MPINIDPNEDEGSAVAAASSYLNVFDDHDWKLMKRWHELKDDPLRHSDNSDDLQEWIKHVLDICEQGNEVTKRIREC